MSDRELLEMAAKAAGIQYDGLDEDRGCDIWWIPELSRYDAWNPLTDDGDAMRLAVVLDLDIEFDCKADGLQTYVTVVGREVQNKTSYEHHGDDPFSATRRAIVRAAAEIGKAMP